MSLPRCARSRSWRRQALPKTKESHANDRHQQQRPFQPAAATVGRDAQQTFNEIQWFLAIYLPITIRTATWWQFSTRSPSVAPVRLAAVTGSGVECTMASSTAY